MATDNRPLSPHLQIYRPQISSILSILHRLTGVGLGLGSVFLTWWLVAAASGDAAFATASDFAGSHIGKTLLLGFTAAFFYHLCNGIRHLLWDTGRGFQLDAMRRSGWAVVICATILTLAAFAAGYAAKG